MEKDYAMFATNWWASKIKKSAEGSEKSWENFEQLLYNKICELSAKNASLTISTCSKDNMLEELAFNAGLLVSIPSGYEMRVILDHVSIYNSVGTLVTSF